MKPDGTVEQRFLLSPGVEPDGDYVSTTKVDHLRGIHDVLHYCVRHRLHLSMLSRSFWNGETDDLYRKVTGGGELASSLLEVLAAGGNIRWLVWHVQSEGLLDSPVLSALMEGAKKLRGTSNGLLSIRLSGTNQNSAFVPHQMIGHPGSRSGERWVLRVEQLQSGDTDPRLEPVNTPELWAQNCFGSGAAENARELLGVFGELFDAVGRADEDQSGSVHRPRVQQQSTPTREPY